MIRLTAFLAELKRRRVFRVSIVYAGVAFIIIQIIDGAFEYLRIPEWIGTTIIVLLLIGFPIAVALAWAFDITEEGLVRTKPKREPAAAKAPHHIVIGNKTLAVIAVLAIIVAAWSWLREPSTGGAAIRSIAVLPLDNLMGDPDQEYFVEGMHEALISALSRISALTVISRTSAMRYRDTDMLVPEIAEELGVDAVVEGSVLKAGDQVRITAQLIDGRTDKHLWTEKYDRDLRNILSLHSEVAQAIAEEIRVTLTPEEEARLASARPVNPEAYKAYLLGRHYWNNLRHSKGLEYFQRAVEKDINYALAYTGIADSYIYFGWGDSYPPNDVFPMAKAAAEKALQIDPNLAEAHTSLAWINLLYDWDWPAAESGFKRAAELNPSYAHAYHGLYQYYIIMGHLDESLAAIKQAQTLDPLSPEIYSHVINIYRLMGRYEEGIKEYNKAVEMNMQRGLLDWQIGLLYCRQGNYQAAIDLLQTLTIPLFKTGLGYAYAMSGQRAEAEEIIKELKEGRQGRPIHSYFIAYIYIGLGEIDTAFEWLERAYQERAPDLIQINAWPEFDFLRNDPRYQALLRRMNFPE